VLRAGRGVHVGNAAQMGSDFSALRPGAHTPIFVFIVNGESLPVLTFGRNDLFGICESR